MAQRVLYLVRHGHYDYSAAQPPDGLGGGLAATGLDQARLTAERLGDLPIQIIHHSPLRRAAETAALIGAAFPGVPLQPSSLLTECIPCFPAAMQAQFPHVTPERLEREGRQAEQAFARYFQPADGAERYEVIVCHGNIIRYFVCRALQAPPECWVYADMHNCGLSQVMVEPDGRFLVVSHNDTGHLPPALRTHL